MGEWGICPDGFNRTIQVYDDSARPGLRGLPIFTRIYKYELPNKSSLIARLNSIALKCYLPCADERKELDREGWGGG